MSTPPAGWTTLMGLPCVQLVDAGAAAAPREEAMRLGADDVDELLGLLARTRPDALRGAAPTGRHR